MKARSGLNAIRSLDYVILLCDDIEEMKHFYRDVMDFEIDGEDPKGPACTYTRQFCSGLYEENTCVGSMVDISAFAGGSSWHSSSRPLSGCHRFP